MDRLCDAYLFFRERNSERRAAFKALLVCAGFKWVRL